MAMTIRSKFWRAGRPVWNESVVSPRLKLRQRTYQPLSVAGREIRVCRLTKHHDEPRIRAELRVISLNNGKASFSCLSYVWGDRNDREEIIVNGTKTLVTRNLFRCLQQLIAQDICQDIWVDALSIWQDNDQERAHQVEMMSSIFAQAQRVYVSPCYASAADGCPTARVIIEALAADQHLDAIPGFAMNHGGDESDFARLIRSQWFERVWCVQEVRPISPLANHGQS
jgi:hypothetical protein